MEGTPGSAGQDTPGDVHVWHRRLHPERHRGLEHLAHMPDTIVVFRVAVTKPAPWLCAPCPSLPLLRV